MPKNIKISNFFAFHILILVFFFILLRSYTSDAQDVTNKTSDELGSSVVVPIGVVLDLNSSIGLMVDLCMRMAISDFYGANPDHRTRLRLHTKNADSVLDANFAGT